MCFAVNRNISMSLCYRDIGKTELIKNSNTTITGPNVSHRSYILNDSLFGEIGLVYDVSDDFYS